MPTATRDRQVADDGGFARHVLAIVAGIGVAWLLGLIAWVALWVILLAFVF